MKKAVYGISDLVTDLDAEPQKYAKVYDVHGKLLGEVEVYIMGYEEEE